MTDQYGRVVRLFDDYGVEPVEADIDKGCLIVTFESGHEIMLFLDSGYFTVYDADADEVIYE